MTREWFVRATAGGECRHAGREKAFKSEANIQGLLNKGICWADSHLLGLAPM